MKESITSSPVTLVGATLKSVLYSCSLWKSTDESQSVTPALLQTAWAESPALAVQLLPRFKSLKLAHEVRWMLLNFPDKAMGEPDALQILLGATLPDDISFQLKVCLLGLSRDNLTFTVPTLLGSSQPYHRCHLLFACICESSIHHPIRHARS